ncbi:phosphosulfolactate synthase [Rossellomorea aquimaris]|uniref:phosphosulfolactate synthase n=1 Tax=Rossellomorea aquimaris TaxID=189382 RepID=UPI001CD50F70|nr:phosphosulfolactate synthase [Rossellomorea aquimaris]MCA1055306.1 phosphosulfolactate synthase [Rossellomorea aquimaris]
MKYLKLPNRTKKFRKTGITAVTDVGVPIKELQNILEDYHEFIDVAKFGIGTAAVSPKLKEKIQLYKDYQVTPYFGGTLFEKFYYEDNLNTYLKFLSDFEVDWIEISSGTITIPLEERLEIAKNAMESGFTVLAEVGSKDPENIMAPSSWIHEIKSFIEVGCKYVITEGRDSASAGIYRPNGELRAGLVSDVIAEIPAEKLIFEAPTPKTQMLFINLIGPNVNVGNIPLRDLLLLETQRQGLRSETFHVNVK